ncbi:hypothetical protein IWW52_002432 [Coemansia sp. RSA 2704]|nr:hypothetical protein IWW54_002766 [Coemansia sp. RSA 2705]KAJ2318664.1 hypothetical protein IWW52_002432 [Coemansia sp. RSA 2704]
MSSISSGILTASGQHFGSSLARAVTTSRPTLKGFDLQEYLGGYKGYAKIRRAIYAGERCPDLSVESYRVALGEVEQNTYDAKTFTHLCKTLSQLTGDDIDGSEWSGRVNKLAKDQDTEIRGELERAKKQVSKRESLRAQKLYVELLQKRGMMDEAVRALQEGRNFCADVKDQALLHIDAARISQIMGRWLQVATYIQRTESVLPDPAEPTATELAVLRAQSSFGDCKWSVAVSELQALSFDKMLSGGIFARGVVTARDIALYGTLAGLASLERDQIKAKLIDNVMFGQFLDNMPECQLLLQSYYNSKYADALARLSQIMSFCKLDPVIGPHVAALEQRIKDNIVVLYTQPFASIRMDSMAEALCFSSVKVLEDTLVRMIDSKLIQARIDGPTGFLVKHAVDPRDAALKRVDEMHQAFTLQAELMSARIQYLEEESKRSSTSARIHYRR